MSAENPFDESELDDAVAEILVDPLDQAAMERVCNRALNIPKDKALVERNPMTSASRIQPPRWLRIGGLASSFAASVLFVIWLSSLVTSNALAEIVEHVMQIRSVKFAYRLQYFDETRQSGTTMIRDGMMRIENQFSGHTLVSLVDLKRREGLMLDDERKLVQEFSGQQLTGLNSINPIRELIAAKDKSFKSLGSDSIDGKTVDVFKIRGLSIMGIGGEAEMTLWVDTTTQLPVKIDMLDADPKSKTQITFDQFHWNPVADADSFAMKIPNGYQDAEIFTVPELESEASPESQDLKQGVLFAGRVPSQVEVDYKRGTVTALLREQESSSVRRVNELRQWDCGSGELLWSAEVGGAGDFAVCPAKNLLAVVLGKEIQLRKLSTGEIVRSWASNHLLGCVAFDDGGSRLAHGYIEWARPANSAPPTGGVEIWNVDTGRLEHDIEHLDRVDSVEFAPSSHSLLVSSTNFKCRLYNSETAELEYSLLGRNATFSPDGKHLAMVSAKTSPNKSIGRVDLVSVDAMQVVRSFVTGKGDDDSYLLSLAFSADGSSLVAGDWNGTLSQWEVASGESTSVFEPLPAGVHCVRFAPSNQLISGCEDAILRVHVLTQ